MRGVLSSGVSPNLLPRWIWELGTNASSGASFLAPGWQGNPTGPLCFPLTLAGPEV